MTLGPGSQLGNYKVLRSLGSGGMADVYEAHDETLDRTVALKVLPLEYTRNPQLVARFQKEVRAAAKLNHRNIVTVFEVGQHESYHYFSMRLLTGGDLRKRIESGLTSLEALAILRELADAFAHAHARGFVHRDVKPENVMFDEQGFPVLTDFGIAKALDANTHMTRTGMTMGTPRYLSPEQASGKPVDARADLYSLGVILFEMLVGRPPYDAEESMAVIFKHVTEPIPTLPEDFTRFQPLLERLMAKDPNQRIASAQDLIQAIDELQGHPARTRPPSQVRTAENPLLSGLLTPSPLRTPPPKTPRPVTPPPVARPAAQGGASGEVAVATRVATRPPATKKAASTVALVPAAREAPAAPAAAASPSHTLRTALLATALIAAIGVGLWLAREATTPGPTPGLVQAPQPTAPAAGAAAEQQRILKEKEEAARQAKQREEEAQRKAQAEAAQRKQQEEQARQEQLKRDQEAAARRDAEAKQRAASEADAKRKADAEAAARTEAKRKADAEAAARAEADRRAAAEAAAKRKQEEEAAAAAKRKQEEDAAAQAAQPAPAPPLTARQQKEAAKKAELERRRLAKEEARKKKEENKDEDEEAAKERARRPTGF